MRSFQSRSFQSPPLALLLVLAACTPVAPSARRGGPHEAVPPANPLTEAASSSPPTAATGTTDARAAEPLTDLLWQGPSSLFVSSATENGSDRPSQLIDGLAATAWNGRRGDLVGASTEEPPGRLPAIAFVVPSDAEITELLLTAGFDGVSSSGKDLFTSNYRLRKVRVDRLDGAKATGVEWTLDPNVRTAQRLPFVAPGGAYALSVLEVEPGTEPTWKELTISEFGVRGHVGARRWMTPQPPEVRIMSDGLRSVTRPADLPKEEPAPPFDAFAGTMTNDACATFEATVAPAFATMDPNYLFPKPWCKIAEGTKPREATRRKGTTALASPVEISSSPMVIGRPSFRGFAAVSQVDLELPLGSARGLRLELPEGSVLLRGSEICGNYHGGGCSDDMTRVKSRLLDASVDETAVTVRVDLERVSLDGPPLTEHTALTFYCPLAMRPFGCRRSAVTKRTFK